jgi:outer membrane protein assembly factor BamB
MTAIILSVHIFLFYGNGITAGSVVGAGRILEDTGVKGGLIVHLGCGDGRLTADLYANDSYMVHGLDADADNIGKARQHIHSLNLYGKVSVEKWNQNYLPYTDNLVNLLVSEKLGDIPKEEVLRVLVPNGVAYIKDGDNYSKVIKYRPGRIDEWTHYLYDSTNNAVANDSVVGPPYHLQWVDDPKWTRSHDHLASVSVAVSAGGRIFYIVDEGPTAAVSLPARWFLVSRDAFNGVLLWKRPIGPWEGHLRGFRSGPAGLARRLVAVKERVYVTLGYGKPLSALDAASGKILQTYEGTEGTAEIVYRDGVLFLVLGDIDAQEFAESAKRSVAVPMPRNKRIAAIKAGTGEELWKKSDADTAELMPNTLTVGNGRLLFQNTKEIICLNAINRQEYWRASRPISVNRLGWSTPTLVIHDNVVLSADREIPSEPKASTVNWNASSKGGDAPVGDLIAYSATTGKQLWTCKARECYNDSVDVLVAGGRVWTGDLVRSRDPGITEGRDLLTGQVGKQRPLDKNFFNVGMPHHRCYRNKATNRYLLLGRAGVEFIDLETGKGIANHWVRGTCQYGIMPCNGLLYAPPHSCACYIKAKLNGFNALAPRREPNPSRHNSSKSRLEGGPLYGKVLLAQTDSETDWHTYRHNPARSGSTKSVVRKELAPKWKTPIGGRLSSPVVAGGTVYVSSIDAHTVHALSADHGRALWSYTTGGRVDSPPTFSGGLVLFGSADGWIYCLRATDGELVWRFRASSEERRVMSFGQLESAWPVHGNILVHNNSAYFAAGRSSYLDGGIYLCRLDLLSGRLLSQTRMDSRDPETQEQPKGVVEQFDMPGILPDVLSCDGSSVYMRHKRFDLNGVEQEPSIPHLFSGAGFLDDSWWHRTYWMLGTGMASGWSYWPTVGNVVPSGRLLVMDSSNIYGFGRQQYSRRGSHIGLDDTYYRLFAADRKPLEKGKHTDEKKRKDNKKLNRGPKGYASGQSTVNYHWDKKVPFMVRAMVLANNNLFLAGQNDLANLEESKGAFLRVISVKDGEDLKEYTLDSPPVFDGMAATRGCLYISSVDGRVTCLENN